MSVVETHPVATHIFFIATKYTKTVIFSTTELKIVVECIKNTLFRRQLKKPSCKVEYRGPSFKERDARAFRRRFWTTVVYSPSCKLVFVVVNNHNAEHAIKQRTSTSSRCKQVMNNHNHKVRSIRLTKLKISEKCVI